MHIISAAVRTGLVWLAILACTSPVWLGIGWEIWSAQIRPRLIPQIEIDRCAMAFIAKYGRQALYIVAIDMDRAWRDSRSCELGRLRRIHKAVERLIAELQPPSKPEHLTYAVEHKFKMRNGEIEN